MTIDHEYQHPSLDFLYRYRALKSSKGRTAGTQVVCSIADFERLIDLAKMEHADCDESCDVRVVVRSIEGEA